MQTSRSLHQTELKHPPYIFESKQSSLLKKLNSYSKSELLELQERNLQMLRSSAVIATLPDKGAKLRETNQLIATLLIDENTAQDSLSCFDNSFNLENQMEAMSVLTPRQGARKRSVDLANSRALSKDYFSGSLLRKKRPMQPTCAIFNTSYTRGIPSDQSKVCMMTLDESLKLQNDQRSTVCENEGTAQSDVLHAYSMGEIVDIEDPRHTFPEEESDEDEDETEDMILD
ncbi:hypothetical protein K501DRAFT_283394 [Backusella circina FSU 941]|nr:hypothetical protein K501DRAFT_283394 [Backusella circina FSU 941]